MRGQIQRSRNALDGRLMPRTVVMVHGIFNTGYVFHYLKKQCQQDGHTCYSPSFKPRDGHSGVEAWANQLSRFIDENIPGDQPIVLIGFSMGGIVSRYYLQIMQGAKRVSHFISISSPHHGSYLGYGYFGKAAKQLRPQSSLLNALNAEQDNLKNITCYSLWTPFDLMIVPANSSVWSAAENKTFYSPLHLHMLFNRKVVQWIAGLLRNL